jgi:CDP-2,3-bis-(O-geranylgeranyl)-sn-glycerol synthase
MNLVPVAQVLMLLALANMTPVAAKKLFREVAAAPIDGGLILQDGYRLFGPSKTIRGAAAALVASSVGAPLLALSWHVGVLVAVSAVAGDLVTSFCKRRIGLPSSSRAVGLDQIPESLIPALVCTLVLPLSVWDVALITIIFSSAALALQFGLGLPHEDIEPAAPNAPRGAPRSVRPVSGPDSR